MIKLKPHRLQLAKTPNNEVNELRKVKMIESHLASKDLDLKKK